MQLNLWPFKTKKNRSTLKLGEQLQTDYHAHWLPGIDDGAKTLEDSVSMIKSLHALGYQKLVATPHIMADLYPNTPELIQRKLETVKVKLKEEGVCIELEAAAEYMLDEGFQKHLEQAPMLCIKDNWVLIEQSMLQATAGAEEMIFTLQIKGYQPVLAHPERYIYMHQKKLDRYRSFKQMGCLFQLNLLSLTGYYGKPVAMVAEALLKEGYYDLAGTDAHHGRHIEKLSLFEHVVESLRV